MTQTQHKLEDFKVGQKVKILSSSSCYIPEINAMIGKEFPIDKLLESKTGPTNYEINDWYFQAYEIESFEEVQETQETTPSMFQMGSFNQEAAGMFLDYSFSTNQQNGLCNTIGGKYIAEFLFQQEPFKNSRSYPVEYCIQKKNKKSTNSPTLNRLYFKDGYFKKNMVNRNRESCRLRIWWAYNLAVKLSQDPDALSMFK
jgi:hypothetical protein